MVGDYDNVGRVSLDRSCHSLRLGVFSARITTACGGLHDVARVTPYQKARLSQWLRHKRLSVAYSSPHDHDTFTSDVSKRN